MDHNEPRPATNGAAGLLTLAEWAQQCGYSQEYAWELTAREGFPSPEPGQYRMIPKKRKVTPVPEGMDPLRAVTLEEFAHLIGVAHKTVMRVVRTHTQPLPPAVDTTSRLSHRHHTVSALLAWWNARPATTTRVRLYDPAKLTPFEPQRHPPLPSPQELGVDPTEKVTLTRFATIIGEDRGNVGQYRRLYPEQMPRTADGRQVQDLAKGESATFVFADLHRWWPSRPGSRVGHRADQSRGVTLTGFARVMGVNPAKVLRRRQRVPEQMPRTVDGRRVQDLAQGERPRFDLEDLRRWWQNLPADDTLQ